MNWRKALLSAVLATGLVASIAPRAEAKHYRNDQYAYGQCGEHVDRMRRDQAKINEIGPSGRHRKALRWFQDDLRSAQRDYQACRYGGSYGRNEPYYDDRSYGTYGSYDPYYDRNTSYDPYYDRNASYDPYYDRSGGYGASDPFDYDGDGKFKFKHDWPSLLGIFLNTQVGQ